MNMIEIDFRRTSAISGITRTKTFMVDASKTIRYNRGELLIQEAFPHLSAGDREFIKTGITDEEWDEAFAEAE
jgi:hypothetical protein